MKGNTLIEATNGDFVIAGYSGEQHGAYKHYMIKTDSNGDQIWKKKHNLLEMLFYIHCWRHLMVVT